MFSNIFKNKTVLITGHTGFKGSWASLWLNILGANVVGISDKEFGTQSNFQASNLKKILNHIKMDIRDLKELKKIIKNISPDFLFHFAAQSLVSISYNQPVETFTKNAIGTLNILESIKNFDKKLISVFITSDKVYHNKEWIWGYRENDQLGGYDPYSASKAMAELVIKSYLESFFKNHDIKIGIGRAGNVIGGGDWSDDRIVPDCIRAWYEKGNLKVRNPNSTRPWQFVLEPISGYFTIAKYLVNNKINNGEAYNFGPNTLESFSVLELLKEMKKHSRNASFMIDESLNLKIKETNLLKLNCDKSFAELNWKANLNFEETIKMTMDWYKSYYDSPERSMYEFSKNQIIKYTNIALSKKMEWAT